MMKQVDAEKRILEKAMARLKLAVAKAEAKIVEMDVNGDLEERSCDWMIAWLRNEVEFERPADLEAYYCATTKRDKIKRILHEAEAKMRFLNGEDNNF